jgi:hypothetical protein
MAKKRARTSKGAFIADDPDTLENEAWVEDSKPASKQTAKSVNKKESKYSYGIGSKKDFPPPGTAKYKMMVLSGEIKE